MYDASTLPFDENIRRTAEFVETNRNRVTIEGAVDEIVSAGGVPQDSLCTVERAQRFLRETGVDLIVPNVGTEHRSTVEKARYHGDLAQEISNAVGKILALHGTSSLGTRDIERLKNDGIIKVNIWTRLERIGGQAAARYTLRQIGSILEENEIDELVAEGLLGPAVKDPVRIERDWGGRVGPKLESVAEVARREVWVQAVTPVIREYLHAFGYLNYRRS
jgi:fructose/tagatose bisphosphate aldolase